MDTPNNSFLAQLHATLGVPPAPGVSSTPVHAPERPDDKNELTVYFTTTVEVTITPDTPTDGLGSHEIYALAKAELAKDGDTVAVAITDLSADDYEVGDLLNEHEQEAWDEMYGKTHNWDGSPITSYAHDDDDDDGDDDAYIADDEPSDDDDDSGYFGSDDDDDES